MRINIAYNMRVRFMLFSSLSLLEKVYSFNKNNFNINLSQLAVNICMINKKMY
jgi:hypothetical protein